jgi:tetratricopeptide (TPR) repeat protein
MTVWIALILVISSPYFSPENQLKFADHLFQEGEYKRAIGEYERYLFFADGDERRDWALYRIGLSYEMIGEYDRAISSYERVRHPEAGYRIGCSYFRKGDFNRSLEALRRVDQMPRIKDRARCLEAAALMMLGRADRAETMLKGLADSGSKDVTAVADGLMRLIPSVKSRPHKSPILAALLSTLLPGAGKIYTGRRYDGLYSLSVIGLSGWMAYDGFRDDGARSLKGWAFGAAGLLFYLGNIYGSAISARDFNAGQERKLKEEILDYSSPLLGDFLGDVQSAGSR